MNMEIICNRKEKHICQLFQKKKLNRKKTKTKNGFERFQ